MSKSAMGIKRPPVRAAFKKLRRAVRRRSRNRWWRDRVRDVGGWTRARRDRHRLARALLGVVLLHLQVVVAGFLAEDVVDFPSFQRLALQELARDAVERRLVRGDDFLRLVVRLVEDALHLAIDLDGSGLGEILMLRELAAEEDRFF